MLLIYDFSIIIITIIDFTKQWNMNKIDDVIVQQKTLTALKEWP